LLYVEIIFLLFPVYLMNLKMEQSVEGEVRDKNIKDHK
jgi:hypothetical protein